jgi:quinol monooxygenase YgiN
MTTHARIGTFTVPADRLALVVEFFRDDVVGAFATMDGFVGYEAFVDREAGRYIGISHWASRAALDASAAIAAQAGRAAAQLGAEIAGKPSVVQMVFDTRTHRRQGAG